MENLKKYLDEINMPPQDRKLIETFMKLPIPDFVKE